MDEWMNEYSIYIYLKRLFTVWSAIECLIFPTTIEKCQWYRIEHQQMQWLGISILLLRFPLGLNSTWSSDAMQCKKQETMNQTVKNAIQN